MAISHTPEQKKQKVIDKQNEERTGIKPEKMAELNIRKASDRPTRKARGVFNGTRGKMKIPDVVVRAFTEAGWHLHIFNDTEGRIEHALSNGYEFVTRDEVGSLIENVVSSNTEMGNKVRFSAGTTKQGEGLFAYLMKTTIADYKEEQSTTEQRNTKVDQAIKSGKNVSNGGSSEGFYDAGIKMSS